MIHSKKSPHITSFTQSLISLSFNLLGMLTGTILAINQNIFSFEPWILTVFPSILSIRGAIGGILSAQMGTALHLGTVSPKLRNNTQIFHILLQSVVTLTFISSVTTGVTSYLFHKIVASLAYVDLYALVMVILSTMGLSIIFITPLTLVISIITFKKGYDPDVITYPIISTLADIIVITCYVFVINLHFTANPTGQNFLRFFNLSFMALAFYFTIKNFNKQIFRKNVKEFLLTLAFVSVILNITGNVLKEVISSISYQTHFIIIYPALTTTMGGVGSIIGSTTTTKLALGSIESSFTAITHHLNEVLTTWLASLIIFLIIPIPLFYASIIDTLIINQLLVQLILVNLFSALIMIGFSFMIAVITYKRGWDPDNFVIPLESSIADATTTIMLYLILMII